MTRVQSPEQGVESRKRHSVFGFSTFLIVGVLGLILTGREASPQSLTPALPYSVPMGVGMFRVRAAEPLSKGQVVIRYLHEGYTINVRKIGGGGSFTGHFGLGFGLANLMDLTLSVPMLLDSAGGLLKFGSGDAAASFKLAGPGNFPSGFYFGLETTTTLPTGWSGERALNVRPFTANKRDLSTRMLIDINKKPIALHINIGQVISGGVRQGGMTMAGGIELGTGQLFTMTGEYVSEPGSVVSQTKRMTVGMQFNLGSSFRLEAGLERGLSDDLPELTGLVGIRIVGRGGKKARKLEMEREKIATEELGGVKEGETVQVAVANFAGLEDQRAGKKVGEHIRSVLSSYNKVRIVALREDPVFLDLDGALELAKASGADLVITGRILKYNMVRMPSAQVPLIVGFPKTVSEVEADIRVVEPKKGAMVLSGRLNGRGEQRQGIRLLPTSSDDQMTYLGAREKEQLRDKAVRNLVTHLIAAMRTNFKWLR